MKWAVNASALTSDVATTVAVRGAPPLDDRQLTEEVAGTHLVDRLTVLPGLGRPLLQDHELESRLSLGHQNLAVVRGQLVDQLREHASLAQREAREQVDLAKSARAIAADPSPLHRRPRVRLPQSAIVYEPNLEPERQRGALAR